MKKTELKQLVKEELDNVMREFAEEPATAPVDGEVDEEGGMVKSELLYIADKAQGCADKIQSSDQQLEAWVQSHIAAAKELISHVADYMGYGEEAEETSEETPEEKMPEIDVDKKEKLAEAPVDPIEKTVIKKMADALRAKALANTRKAADLEAGKVVSPSIYESETLTWLSELQKLAVGDTVKVEYSETGKGASGAKIDVTGKVTKIPYNGLIYVQADDKEHVIFVPNIHDMQIIEPSSSSDRDAHSPFKNAFTPGWAQGGERERNFDREERLWREGESEELNSAGTRATIRKEQAESIRQLVKEMVANGQQDKAMALINKLQEYSK